MKIIKKLFLFFGVRYCPKCEKKLKKSTTYVKKVIDGCMTRIEKIKLTCKNCNSVFMIDKK